MQTLRPWAHVPSHTSHKQHARSTVKAAATGRPRTTFNSHLSCPYEVLGLNPDTADEASIKRQYRKLAKQYHPDVAKESKDSTPQFLNITQAYEFLLCQLRKDATGNPRPGNSDAFHDWYWSFRMSRNWQRQQHARADSAEASAAGTQASSSAPQSAEGLRSQLAGLRHRAAIRRQKAATAPMESQPTDGAAQEEEQQQQQPQACQGMGEMQPTQEQQQQQVYAAADGPSDSADPDVRLAAGLDQQQAQEAQEQHAKPRFTSNSNVREGLREQLYGMRRKAALRREFTGSA